jgi:hypothetical protein
LHGYESLVLLAFRFYDVFFLPLAALEQGEADAKQHAPAKQKRQPAVYKLPGPLCMVCDGLIPLLLAIPNRCHAFQHCELFHDATQIEIEFIMAAMMPDENFVSADQLQIARRRLADGHDPIFRLIRFVDVQQRRVAFVNGDEFVLDGGIH